MTNTTTTNDTRPATLADLAQLKADIIGELTAKPAMYDDASRLGYTPKRGPLDDVSSVAGTKFEHHDND